jgi:hypothetical protein
MPDRFSNHPHKIPKTTFLEHWTTFLEQNSAEQALNTLFTLKAINLSEKKFENLSLDIDSKFNPLTRDVNDSREIERQMFVSRQNDL